MKSILVISALYVLTILTGTSCKKQVCGNLPNKPSVPRTIRFVLYSDKDLSADHSNISFKLFIENSTFKTLWDSALASIKIKNIPNAGNKLVVEKLVPNDDHSLLRVGFKYSIGDVGYSGHFVSMHTGETFKIVEFNFQ